MIVTSTKEAVGEGFVDTTHHSPYQRQLSCRRRRRRRRRRRLPPLPPPPRTHHHHHQLFHHAHTNTPHAKGTFFEAIRPSGDTDAPFEARALSTDAGGCVAFGGKLRHGGQAITSGVRYIIPLFVYLDKNNSGEAPGYATKSLAAA